MKIHSKDFRVPHHKKININHLPTTLKPMAYPKTTEKRRLELQAIGKELAK